MCTLMSRTRAALRLPGMTHRLLILGAGYAGVPAAGRLARRVRADEARVTLVNAAPDFVERPRLHQLATGQSLRSLPLRGFLDPVGADLVVGTAHDIDLNRRELVLDGPDGRRVGYDTLVYALGSTIDTGAVPGVAEHAYSLSSPDAAGRLHARAGEISRRGGSLLVCGGGLTGIEVATELAESYPGLQVTLLSPSAPGQWLSARARRHLERAFDRLGVRVRTGARVEEVRADSVLLSDGILPVDACVWAGGFTVPALARQAGLAVDGRGRVRVDRTLRSLSHPDVYAIGDAAAVPGPWGDSLAMGCRSGGFTGPQVADRIADALSGRTPAPFRFRYLHECISLGRRDGVIQFLRADETPTGAVLTGRVAAAYKEAVLTGATWTFRRPGPYRPRPRRRIVGPVSLA